MNCSGNIRFAYCSLSGRVFQTHKSHSNYIASDTAFWLWGMACMMTDVSLCREAWLNSRCQVCWLVSEGYLYRYLDQLHSNRAYNYIQMALNKNKMYLLACLEGRGLKRGDG